MGSNKRRIVVGVSSDGCGRGEALIVGGTGLSPFALPFAWTIFCIHDSWLV
jgi:hypothetical protein